MVNQDNRTQGIVTQDDGLLAGHDVTSTSELDAGRSAATLVSYAGVEGEQTGRVVDRLIAGEQRSVRGTAAMSAGQQALAVADRALDRRSTVLSGPDVAGPNEHHTGQNPPQIHSIGDAVTRLANSGTRFVNSGVQVVRDVRDVADWLREEVGTPGTKEPERSSVGISAAGRGKVLLA